MNKPIRIGNLYGENRGTGFAGNIWETEGISPALTTMGGGKPGTHNNGDSALRGEFTWKGKRIEPWSGFIWNTSADFSRGALKDLSKTLKCDDAMCIMEVVKYEKSEADNSG